MKYPIANRIQASIPELERIVRREAWRELPSAPGNTHIVTRIERDEIRSNRPIPAA